MLTIGVDAHKRVHVAVSLDVFGGELAHWRGQNSPAGWRDLLDWVSAQDEHRRFGVEGAWSYGRGLAQYLVAAGETVYEINPRWTAAGRLHSRKPGKTDRLDAAAVATLVLQEGDSLPHVYQDDESSVLNLLTVERDTALADATRLRNQLHVQLMQLDPEYQLHLPPIRSRRGLAAAKEYTVADPNPLRQVRVAVVRRLAARLELTLDQADEMAVKIRELAERHFKPLTRLCGVNLLTAGALAGILGPGPRFRSDASLAAYAGVSPLEASSAARVRHRLNRGGNRRLNALLFRIAITQARHLPAAQAYLARRTSEEKTRREAYRALKRYLARAVFKLWSECLEDRYGPTPPPATSPCT